MSRRLPAKFIENILETHGESGRRRLADLPRIVDEIAANWSLRVDEPFPNLSYNYVAPCVCVEDGSEAVLKIGFDETDSIVSSEAEFLKILDGDGAVKLLRSDENRRALLLERIVPGENLIKLAAVDDERATTEAVKILKKIRRAPPENAVFSTLEKSVESFLRAEKTAFDFASIKKAQKIFERLVGSSERRLLHGDLHHENILSARREPFLAIDPKGIVGDFGFEISVFLNNPRGWLPANSNGRRTARRRVERFGEAFAIEPRDLRDWAYAEAVLSAWWTIEDGGGGWEKQLARAEIWQGNF